MFRSKKRKTQPLKSTSVLNTAFQKRDNHEKTSLAGAGAAPVLNRESVLSYSGALGCRYDDINFLDCKYDNIRFQTNRIVAKLTHGYEVCLHA